MLSIKQGEPEEYIDHTKTSVRGLDEILDTDPKQQLIKWSKLQLNDMVTILDPSRGQHTKKTIVGVTKDNLAKIRTGDGGVIRKIPKNIKETKHKWAKSTTIRQP